jgi:hypothetical protein
VQNGQVPAPEALDALGFFNEHPIDVEATCDEPACVLGAFVQGQDWIDGSSTPMLVFKWMAGEPVLPQQGPRHIIVLAELGQSMAEHFDALERALRELPSLLGPEDRISLVSYANHARVLVEQRAAGDPSWSDAVALLQAEGFSNLYAGLEACSQLMMRAPSANTKLILLTAGAANAGIVQHPRILALARSIAEQGCTLSALAMGEHAQYDFVKRFVELGNGGLYWLDDASSLLEVCREELQNELTPVATAGLLRLSLSQAFSVDKLFGPSLASASAREAYLDLPLLSLAARGAEAAQGRRGAGALFAISMTQEAELGAHVAEAVFSYQDLEGKTWTRALEVGSATPASFDVRRAAEVVNLYRRLKMVLELAQVGDLDASLALLQSLSDALAVRAQGDADWQADLELTNALANNLRALGAGSPPTNYRTPVLEWW